MKGRDIKVGIAVVVALAVFVFVFGHSFFPQVPIFQYFSYQIFNPSKANTSVPSEGPPILEIVPDAVLAQDALEGTGSLAELGKEVAVRYRLTIPDEETRQPVVVDENFTGDKELFRFVLGAGEVIPGFDLGVAGMREGGIRFIQIAPHFGYGDRQAGEISPNTTLLFEVHLHEVR